jgi:hypothetical protein
LNPVRDRHREITDEGGRLGVDRVIGGEWRPCGRNPETLELCRQLRETLLHRRDHGLHAAAEGDGNGLPRRKLAGAEEPNLGVRCARVQTTVQHRETQVVILGDAARHRRYHEAQSEGHPPLHAPGDLGAAILFLELPPHIAAGLEGTPEDEALIDSIRRPETHLREGAGADVLAVPAIRATLMVGLVAVGKLRFRLVQEPGTPRPPAAKIPDSVEQSLPVDSHHP